MTPSLTMGSVSSAFNKPRFIVIYNDTANSSYDGQTWTARSNPVVSNYWYDATSGNGVAIAVSTISGSYSENNIMRTTDGIRWTAASVLNPVCIAYGNGTFVIGSGGSAPLRSTNNGQTWTAHGWPGDSYIGALAYGNGLFVGVGAYNTNRILTSPDGITWTPRTQPSGSRSWRSAAYGNGTFVIGNNDSSSDRLAAATSTDGINWTARTVAQEGVYQYALLDLAYGAGLFVAVTGTQNYYTSADGVSWTARSMGSDINAEFIAFGHGRFVACGSGVATSTNGTSWSLSSFSTSSIARYLPVALV